MPRHLALVVLLAAGTASARQASHQGLGVLPGYDRSSARALSADGTTVVGMCNTGTTANWRPFRWTASGGMQDLGVLPGGAATIAHDVDADGTVAVGQCVVAGSPRAFRWTAAGGMQELIGPAGAIHAIAMGVSDDGLVVTGTAWHPTSTTYAFRWTAGSGAVWLPAPVGWLGAEGLAISATGSIIAGRSGGAQLPPAAPFLLVSIPQAIAVPFGLDTFSVHISGDGAVVVGVVGTLAQSRGFRWTQAGGFQLLPAPGAFTWSANAVSHDGSVIGGGMSPFPDSEAYIWSDDPGNVLLARHLASLGVNLAGWELGAVTGVSADGRKFAGNGTRTIAPGQTRDEAWIASLGPVCYPDCNKDGALTVADFGCFQSRFVGQDPYADCNADAQLTVADFGCFQTRFVGGCP